MELILIRHALPVRLESEDGSAVDPGLSREGEQQAWALAKWWKRDGLDRLYCSPLLRARQTAAPLSKELGLDIEIEDGVAEMDRESSSYIPLEELKRTDYPRWKAFVDGAYELETDMERFRQDVIGALEKIVQANSGRRVAVVCHGGVINTYAARVLGVAPRLFFDPFYTSWSRFLAAASGERNVASLNETPHLYAGP